MLVKIYSFQLFIDKMLTNIKSDNDYSTKRSRWVESFMNLDLPKLILLFDPNL
jgi:hypothetical protein